MRRTGCSPARARTTFATFNFEQTNEWPQPFRVQLKLLLLLLVCVCAVCTASTVAQIHAKYETLCAALCSTPATHDTQLTTDNSIKIQWLIMQFRSKPIHPFHDQRAPDTHTHAHGSCPQPHAQTQNYFKIMLELELKLHPQKWFDMSDERVCAGVCVCAFVCCCGLSFSGWNSPTSAIIHDNVESNITMIHICLEVATGDWRATQRHT